MLEVRELTFSYPHSQKLVLNKVSFTLEDGQVLAVLGTNGAGKSTLLHCIDGLLKPQHGSIYLDGQSLNDLDRRALARQVAYVHQQNVPPDMTVFDLVLLGRRPYIRWDATAEDRAIVESVLERLHLTDYALRNVNHLSGGEMQKIMIGRALAQQPRLLLLDEPTSNLDPHNQQEVLKLVSTIARENQITVIVILHDLNLACRHCQQFLFLHGNTVHASGDSSIVTSELIRHVYNLEAEILEHHGHKVMLPL